MRPGEAGLSVVNAHVVVDVNGLGLAARPAETRVQNTVSHAPVGSFNKGLVLIRRGQASTIPVLRGLALPLRSHGALC